MNHLKIYEAIIAKAKSENRKKLKKNEEDYVYYDNHHIYPKCLGGGNQKENMQLLTAHEHYVCHKLLTYIYTGNKGIAWAFHRMTYSKFGDHIKSGRDYAYARELISKIPVSEETKQKMSENKIVSEETKKHLKEINTGEKNPMFGKCNYVVWVEKFGEEIAKEKHKEWRKNKSKKIPWNKDKIGCFSEEAIQKLSVASSGENNGMHGKKHKEESIEKMKNRIFSEETKKLMSDNHADISGDKNPMFGTKFKWMSKNNKNKRADLNEIDILLSQGWQLGRKKKER